ncbi:MAG: hypothetical protein IPP74_13915 [Alphaproteobacteria bacterium]|nr:hypothetical protein [Alphaproteobacteria bacterium]
MKRVFAEGRMTLYAKLLLMFMVLVSYCISPFSGEASSSRTCQFKRDKQFDLEAYETAEAIQKALLDYYPVGGEADCVAYMLFRNDVVQDVFVRPEPIDMSLQRIIRLHYKKGTFHSQEYWIEIIRRIKPSKDKQGHSALLLTNEIEGIDVRKVTQEEEDERKKYLKEASDFKIDSYGSDVEAQEAFLKLHPIGSPAHLAHYTLMKAGGKHFINIVGNDLSSAGSKEIIRYRFKKGVLGWGGYYVDIYRKVKGGILLNEVEQVKLYKTYQGL